MSIRNPFVACLGALAALTVGCQGQLPGGANAPAALTGKADNAGGPSANQCRERARSFSGDQAKNMIQALMFAKVAPTAHAVDGDNTTDVYTLKDGVHCQDTHAYDDNITRYSCTLPDSAGEDARAKVLFDAIYGLKIYGDAGLGHTFARLSTLSCTLSVGADVGYTCIATGMWDDDCAQ
jgi:hypothetical protein